MTQDDAQGIALSFVRNEATFRFDGIEGTLNLVNSRRTDSGRREFTYSYQCRQASYGDRTGMMLAQVITDHLAVVTMEAGVVTSGVLDGKWDMLRQKFAGS